MQRFIYLRGAPISAEMARAVSRTRALSAATRSSMIRADGPAADPAATTSPVSPTMGAECLDLSLSIRRSQDIETVPAHGRQLEPAAAR
jgi:hypothetical protein